jgi:hypothetical protein
VRPADNWLANELVGLISDEARAVFGYVDGEPTALPSKEKRWWACASRRCPPRRRTPWRSNVGQFALGADANLALTEQTEPSGAVLLRERSWTFQDARQVLVVATTQQLVGRFRGDQGPHEGELLARAAAERLGRPVPGLRAEGDAGT